MPAVSKGTQVWSMKLKGTMDTSEIDSGVKRVGKGFDGVKGKVKSFGGDMKRVASTVAGLAKKLLFMGVAGAGALVALAAQAPAVAPALAKMSVTMEMMKRSLGEALAPAFERVAGWLEKLGNWVGKNKGQIGEIADKFLDWAEVVGEKLWPVLRDIGTWAADHPGLFTGIVAGLALAPAVLAGISSLSTFVTLMGGAAVSASLLAGLGLIGIIVGTTAAVVTSIIGMVEALTAPSRSATGVPITPQAQAQIAAVSEFGLSTPAGIDLNNRYASGFGGGSERTARVDIDTGELYSNSHMERDIIANANVSYDYHNYEADKRSWFMQQWQKVWN